MRKFNLHNLIWLFVFSLFFFHSTAQEKIANSLLWRISGNGLTAPSYLYGTIHLNDERVFNFGDSLYQAISNTEGFAMELNPQQLTLYVLDQIKQEISQSKKISEILSVSDYKKYGPLMAKKLGKNQSDITTADIMREKNKWVREKFKTGTMQTIVDAYLFDVAMRQGKWTGGIEDLQDQLNTMNDVVDKSDIVELAAEDKGKSDLLYGAMIDAYVNADLDAIAAFSKNEDSLEYDKVITKRNIRMAARMDSMAHVRKMVFAVGTAHLPGSAGIIELLRIKGYQVDPVRSSKNIKPGEYIIKEKTHEWEMIRDNNGLYQVNMPGKAEDLKLYGILLMKVNIDFTKSSGYFTAALTSPFQTAKLDALLDSISYQIFPRGASRRQNGIALGTALGKEYSIENDDGLRRGYIVRRDNKVFVVLGFISKVTKEGLADIDRFLKSFTILQEPARQIASKIHYIDSAAGFALDLPSAPELLKEYSGIKKKDGVKTSFYSATDANSGTIYLFSVNTVLTGSFIPNDSIYLSLVVSNVKQKIDSIKVDTTFYEDDIRIHELAGILKQNRFLQIHSRYYIRGNRWYGLVSTFGADKPVDFEKRYFDSFHFLPFPSSIWKIEISPDSVLSSWCPTPILILSDQTESADKVYDATDSITAHIYDVVAWHMPDYYWAKSDSAFWANKISTKIAENDSLIYKKPVRNGDVEGWEFEKSSKHTLVRQRYRIMRYGDEMYTALTAKSPSEINDENTNRFFESIRFQKPAPATHMLISHAGLLLSKLFSNDSATAAQALQFVENAPLSTNDLDTLHHALLRIGIYEKNNPLKDKWNKQIVLRIRELHDSSSFNFARDNYRLIPDSNAELKTILLEIMSSFPSVTNFNAIADLLNSSPPEMYLANRMRNDFKDTSALTAMIIPKLLPLLKNYFLSSSVMDICNTLIDSNLLNAKQLSPYVTASVQYARERVRLLRYDIDNYYALDPSVILFLGKLKNQASNVQLKQYLLVKDKFIRYRTMQALMRNGIQADPSIYLELAGDKYYRVYMYNFLKQMNKLSLFPLTYKTQKLFAESNIWEFANEDYEPQSITFLTQKQINFRGQLSNFYFFKVGFDRSHPEVTYLTSSGPYLAKSSDPGENDSFAKLYLVEQFEIKKMQAQISALLKKYSETD